MHFARGQWIIEYVCVGERMQDSTLERCRFNIYRLQSQVEGHGDFFLRIMPQVEERSADGHTEVESGQR